MDRSKSRQKIRHGLRRAPANDVGKFVKRLHVTAKRGLPLLKEAVRVLFRPEKVRLQDQLSIPFRVHMNDLTILVFLQRR